DRPQRRREELPPERPERRLPPAPRIHDVSGCAAPPGEPPRDGPERDRPDVSKHRALQRDDSSREHPDGPEPENAPRPPRPGVVLGTRSKGGDRTPPPGRRDHRLSADRG